MFGKGKLVARGLPLLCVVVAGCAQNPQAAKEADNQTNDKSGLLSRILGSKRTITVPEGTDLTVVLDQGLSSAQNRPGDAFQASVAAPIAIDGRTSSRKTHASVESQRQQRASAEFLENIL